MASDYAELRHKLQREMAQRNAAAGNAVTAQMRAAKFYARQRAAQHLGATSSMTGGVTKPGGMVVIPTGWGTPVGTGYARAAQNFYPPPPQLKTDGIVVGEIVAHRVWVCQMGFLRSVFMSEVVWAPHEAQSGKPDYGHGIHAWKTQSQALQYGMGPATGGGIQMVYGRVLLWGDVIEHENGYRAEHAKVLAIDGVLPDDAALLAVLRAKYDEP